MLADAIRASASIVLYDNVVRSLDVSEKVCIFAPE